mgnify:CR=1 FL=1
MDFTTNGTLGKNSTVTNGYTGETFSVAGKRGSTGIFTASGGDTTLYGDTFAANLNDAFIYDFTIGGTNALRFVGITLFDLGAGNDLLDLTVRPVNAASAYTTDVTAYGGAGDDVIWGGDGRDTLYGDVSELSGQGGDDVVRGGGSSNTLYGDAYDIATGGQGGNDLLYGGEGPDSLIGDAWFVYAGSVSGDDELHGGDGNDYLYGDAYRAYDDASFGDDVLKGGDGNDDIQGDAYFFSSDSQGGDDILEGGPGNDKFWGDAQSRPAGSTGGADTFVFGPDSGADTIYDFGFGADVIDVSQWGFIELGDLTIQGNGSSAVTVGFDADNYVTVVHHDGQSLTLTASDFIFADPPS